MKKNNLYILIGLAAVGGFYFYMKKKKKEIVNATMQDKIIEPVVIQKQEPNPLKSLVKAVKKISKPKAKPAQVTVQQTDMQFDPLGFQSNVVNKEFLQKVKSGKVKKEKYNFPFLKPRTIKGLPDFF
jgi:LPXTG-motif cell wall-anchored protein